MAPLEHGKNSFFGSFDWLYSHANNRPDNRLSTFVRPYDKKSKLHFRSGIYCASICAIDGMCTAYRLVALVDGSLQIACGFS